ncbi:prolyl oligopeptidase family serine peptidase [Pyrofollis japonicus]|nr:prolyl oligopeptidase family serine peptidase [Pyrofollis japonicus]
MEHLEAEETRKFIESMSIELRRFLGDLPSRYRGLLAQLLSQPRVTGLAAAGSGLYLLYKGARDLVAFTGWDGGFRRIVRIADGDEVIPFVERVMGSELLAIHVSMAGADEGYVDIVGPDGGLEARIRGSAWGFALVGGELYYARFYRREPPPDGGSPPVQRIVRRSSDGGEEVVWGSGVAETGSRLSLYYVPQHDLLVYGVWRGWDTSWLYVAYADEPGRARLVVGGDAAYTPVGWAGGLVVLRRGLGGDKLLVYDEHSEEIIPLVSLDRPAEAATVFGDSVAVVTVEDYMHRLRVYGLSGERLWSYEPREPSSIRALAGSERVLALLETSFTKPYRIVLLGREGEARTLEEAVHSFEARVGEFWVRSRDGTLIHSWLVAPAEERPRAVVVYGYGGFSISLTPAYRVFVETLVRNGFAFVQANLRGGREEGEEWHRAGMLRNKHKVFEDYAAVAKHLKTLGCRVAGWGVSNGGLLIAAVETRWPGLLDAALIGYPVIDMLRYHRLHVGRLWVPEYGDPEDPEMRHYLISYSPYHNIPVGEKMPPTLVYTGLRDDRVHPGHAIKYAAKARRHGHPVYLRVETRSGHSGATAEVAVDEIADMLAFLVKTLGLREGDEIETKQ